MCSLLGLEWYVVVGSLLSTSLVCVCPLLGGRLRKLIKIRSSCSPSVRLFSVDCHLEVHNLIDKLLTHL